MLKIENLFYCPVKSISFTESNSLNVIKNKGIENDRIFAFVQNQDKNQIKNLQENPSLRKLNNFISLKNTPELNKYNFKYINGKLLLRDNSRDIISINPYNYEDKLKISKTIRKLIKKEKKIDFICDKINPFFDTMPDNSISLINKNSIEDFEKKVSLKIEFERFRANIYVSGVEEWAERKWIGKLIQINNVKFLVTDEIPRCSATNLQPGTDNNTMNLPNFLKKTYDHINMGVFLIPQNNGNIFINDKIEIYD